MKKILNLVITGGPCGGKTTSLQILKEYFEQKGFKVFTVEETATSVIRSGAIPKPDGSVSLEVFQWMILIEQLSKEIAIRKAAMDCDEEKVVILYDRAVLDNRAYISHKIFQKMIDQLGITEKQIMSWYDLILHMVSPAYDKPDVYNKGNVARMENVERARQVEADTIQAWPECDKKHVFYNDCDFPEKIRRMIEVIDEEIAKWENTQETIQIQETEGEKHPTDTEIIYTMIHPLQFVKH